MEGPILAFVIILLAFYYYPYISIVILLFIAIYYFFKTKRFNEKKNKYDALNRQKMDTINKNIEQVRALIMSNFDGDICNRCLENNFQVLTFNSNYTSVHVQCNMCSRKSWLKSLNDNSSKKIEELMIEANSQGGGYYNIDNESYNFVWKEYIVHNPDNLIFPESNHKKILSDRQREPIPDAVKNKVWRRDKGECVKCGSNENLEFDHIIPHSKGGSNTYRNLQLLCESCNRSKSAKI